MPQRYGWPARRAEIFYLRGNIWRRPPLCWRWAAPGRAFPVPPSWHHFSLKSRCVCRTYYPANETLSYSNAIIRVAGFCSEPGPRRPRPITWGPCARPCATALRASSRNILLRPWKLVLRATGRATALRRPRLSSRISLPKTRPAASNSFTRARARRHSVRHWALRRAAAAPTAVFVKLKPSRGAPVIDTLEFHEGVTSSSPGPQARAFSWRYARCGRFARPTCPRHGPAFAAAAGAVPLPRANRFSRFSRSLPHARGADDLHPHGPGRGRGRRRPLGPGRHSGRGPQPRPPAGEGRGHAGRHGPGPAHLSRSRPRPDHSRPCWPTAPA